MCKQEYTLLLCLSTVLQCDRLCCSSPRPVCLCMCASLSESFCVRVPASPFMLVIWAVIMRNLLNTRLGFKHLGVDQQKCWSYISAVKSPILDIFSSQLMHYKTLLEMFKWRWECWFVFYFILNVTNCFIFRRQWLMIYYLLPELLQCVFGFSNGW